MKTNCSRGTRRRNGSIVRSAQNRSDNNIRSRKVGRAKPSSFPATAILARVAACRWRYTRSRRQANAPTVLLHAMVPLHEQVLQDHAGHAATVQGDEPRRAERPAVRQYASQPTQTSPRPGSDVHPAPTDRYGAAAYFACRRCGLTLKGPRAHRLDLMLWLFLGIGTRSTLHRGICSVWFLGVGFLGTLMPESRD